MEPGTETKQNPTPPPGPQVAIQLDALAGDTQESTPGLEPPPGTPVPTTGAWKEIVRTSLEDFKKVTSNWTHPETALQLIALGLEKQLDRWAPNGMDDWESIPPAVIAGVGLVLLLVANLERRQREDGTVAIGLKPIQPRPPEKKKEPVAE